MPNALIQVLTFYSGFVCRLCTCFLAATFYFAQMFDGVRHVSLLFFLVYIHPASTEIYTPNFARHERALRIVANDMSISPKREPDLNLSLILVKHLV